MANLSRLAALVHSEARPQDGAAEQSGRVAGRDYPSAAASLIEGLGECFTINRLDVPASLHRLFGDHQRHREVAMRASVMRTRRLCRLVPYRCVVWTRRGYPLR